MSIFASTWRFVTGHDKRLNQAREIIEKSAGSLEDLAFRENGAARADMLNSLRAIDDAFANAKADVRPILEEEFTDEWRKEVRQKAWIQYMMNSKLFEVEGQKRNFFEMVDYTSPYIRNEELAKKSGIYRASFNFKFEELMKQFIEKIPEHLLEEIARQVGGPNWDPAYLKELDSAIKLSKTLDVKEIRKIVNKKFIDFLQNQLEIANYRADVKGFAFNTDFGKFYFPYGISRFHILADRLDYMLRGLKDSEDPENLKKYQDHIQNMRVMEVRVFEERAKRNAKIAQSRKQSLESRANALQNMTFYLDRWAHPLNREYAEKAKSEEHGQYQELELFDPDPDFYEDIIKEMFLDLDPIDIKELPNPEELKSTLDNVIAALKESFKGILSAQERKLANLKRKIGSEENHKIRNKLQDESISVLFKYPNWFRSDGFESEYYPAFQKAARKLVAEVMDQTKEKLYAAARRCDKHSVAVIQGQHNILRDAYGKDFPEELNIDFNDEIDTLYRENIARVLEDLVEGMKKAVSGLEFGVAKRYAQAYYDKQKAFVMYIPDDCVPVDIEAVKADEIEKAKEAKKPEEIKAKAEGLYEKAGQEFTAGLSNPEYLNQAVPTLDHYVELCKLFPETGVSEDQLKANVQALIDKVYDLAEAKRSSPMDFMPYVKIYLDLANHYQEILGPIDLPSVMKKLGFEVVDAKGSGKPRELEIEIEDGDPNPESQ